MNDSKRFNGKAEIYDKYRPNYSSKALDIILSFCEIDISNNMCVADIGAGTGKFSKLLLDRGFNVYAIEPNDDMRNLAELNFSN